MEIFLNIAPKRALRGNVFKCHITIIHFCLNDVFHQQFPQYALCTIEHTILYGNHNSLIFLNNLLRTSARSAEIVLTIYLILFNKFFLKQAP